ncbi:uncharacterized protein LOC110227792 [Arabidopsis lyrata subsp. lyrata]|uniref:uncharacterized protein LOC110227792 n=1 Tax=Arabidopsis lyrata subsp. lyrata TaxID=81972 RepID=UPI000A29C0A9|nr:uncharacterized protein LOC110227792 [Arabidopsis lyrata subsp. lyrata]|eukprot:XP_020879060.1 uncharacterized protein LOC110227792 [Arabidopsis lyrata subsp. lyrata]
MISVSSFVWPFTQSSSLISCVRMESGVSSSIVHNSKDAGSLSVSLKASSHRISSLLATSSPPPKIQPNLPSLVFEFSGCLPLGSFRPMLLPVKEKKMSGSANLIVVGVSREDPSFPQVGLGPFSFSSRPIFERCVSSCFLQKSRSGPHPLLFFLSQFLSRFMPPIDRGRQLEHNLSLLLCWFKIYLRTLPLEPPSCIIHEFKSLKKDGIMIPSLRSGDYQNFFNFSSPLHLFTESNQLLLLFSIIRDSPLEFKSLKKNGIMIPSLRSGDYRNFFNFSSPLHLVTKSNELLLLFSIIRNSPLEYKSLKKNGIMIPSPTSGDYRNFLNPSYPLPLIFKLKIVPKEIYIFQDILLFVPTSSLRFVSTNQEAKDFFSTSHDLLIVTTTNFADLLAEVSMTHFEVACGMWLVCLCL